MVGIQHDLRFGDFRYGDGDGAAVGAGGLELLADLQFRFG